MDSDPLFHKFESVREIKKREVEYRDEKFSKEDE